MIFGRVIFIGRRSHIGKYFRRFGTAVYRNVVFAHGRKKYGQRLFGNLPVYEQTFKRIAHAGTLQFAVDKYFFCNLNVAAFLNVQMAVAGACFYYRNG